MKNWKSGLNKILYCNKQENLASIVNILQQNIRSKIMQKLRITIEILKFSEFIIFGPTIETFSLEIDKKKWTDNWFRILFDYLMIEKMNS